MMPEMMMLTLAFSVRHSLAEAQRRVGWMVVAAPMTEEAEAVAEVAVVAVVVVVVETEEVEEEEAEAVKVTVADDDDCGDDDDGDDDVARVDDEEDHPSSFLSHPLILHGRRHGVDHR